VVRSPTPVGKNPPRDQFRHSLTSWRVDHKPSPVGGARSGRRFCASGRPPPWRWSARLVVTRPAARRDRPRSGIIAHGFNLSPCRLSVMIGNSSVGRPPKIGIGVRYERTPLSHMTARPRPTDVAATRLHGTSDASLISGEQLVAGHLRPWLGRDQLERAPRRTFSQPFAWRRGPLYVGPISARPLRRKRAVSQQRRAGSSCTRKSGQREQPPLVMARPRPVGAERRRRPPSSVVMASSATRSRAR